MPFHRRMAQDHHAGGFHRRWSLLCGLERLLVWLVLLVGTDNAHHGAGWEGKRGSRGVI